MTNRWPIGTINNDEQSIINALRNALAQAVREQVPQLTSERHTNSSIVFRSLYGNSRYLGVSFYPECELGEVDYSDGAKSEWHVVDKLHLADPELIDKLVANIKRDYERFIAPWLSTEEIGTASDVL